jgi:hypothetical protein
MSFGSDFLVMRHTDTEHASNDRCHAIALSSDGVPTTAIAPSMLGPLPCISTTGR